MVSSISLIALLVIIVSFSEVIEGDGHGGGHNHIIIHVPYHIKKIKHTHTITKHIHHGGGGGDKYEVLGYTIGHPIIGGHGGHGDYGGHVGHGGHGFEDGDNEIGIQGYGGGMESFGHEDMSAGH